MRVLHTVLLLFPLAALGCTSSPQGTPSSSARQSSPPTQPADEETRAEAGPPPLGEFEALTQPDVDLYLKVMRTAAARVQNMPPSDQAAVKTLRKLSSNPTPGAMPSPEEMAAIQRAGELIVMDAMVARELGVERRYSSISSRVDHFVMPMEGEGDATPMSADERAALLARIQRFKELRAHDAATLAPHRAEIVSLQKQVKSVQF